MSARQVWITDVGPRDGLQNQAGQVATAGKIGLIEALARAGVRSIEGTSFVSPKAVPQMADAAEVMAGVRDLEGVEISALVPNSRGLERAAAAGSRCVAVVLSATDTMNRRNINMSLEEALEESLQVIAAANARSLRVRAYLAVAVECRSRAGCRCRPCSGWPPHLPAPARARSSWPTPSARRLPPTLPA
jgi:hydroxymethylglutaryl-CoA lyase